MRSVGGVAPAPGAQKLSTIVASAANQKTVWEMKRAEGCEELRSQGTFRRVVLGGCGKITMAGSNANDPMTQSGLIIANARIRLLKSISWGSGFFVPISLVARSQSLDQIPELLSAEVVAVQIGGQASVAANDDGVKGVHKKRFVRIKRHIE